MKNHIVSQMIIKRFADAINVFDLKTGRIDLKKKPAKVFYKHDRLPEDLELMLSKEIESPFANLLYGKLNEKDVIKLTRKEMLVIRKYLLMVSVRMFDEEEFYVTIKNFKKNCEKYYQMEPKIRTIKRLEDFNYSPKEFYLTTLRVICENNNPLEMLHDPRTTLEMYCWSRPIYDSYIAFWDAPENMEFILSDCSMVSEYEGVHQLTGGLDLSKFSYSYFNLLNNKNEMLKNVYANLLMQCELMYENYNLFNLSSKRSMVLVNPFFRQYFDQKIHVIGGEDININAPDIWPSILQNKELFRTPTNEYVRQGVFLPEDKFVYEVKKLSEEELVYINSSILKMSHNIIGFNSIEAIKGSINYSLWEEANLRGGHFMSIDSCESGNSFIDALFSSKLLKLSELKGVKEDTKSSFISLFERIYSDILKDFKTNKYICWYLLFNEKETRKNTNLNFLGNADERIILFKERYKELWGSPFKV